MVSMMYVCAFRLVVLFAHMDHFIVLIPDLKYAIFGLFGTLNVGEMVLALNVGEMVLAYSGYIASKAHAESPIGLKNQEQRIKSPARAVNETALSSSIKCLLHL
jgi:hypothetical protein